MGDITQPRPRKTNPRLCPRPVPRIKIITLGKEGVGKSCLVKRYCEKRFVSKYNPTVGVDYGVTQASSGGVDVRVNFFDLSGDLAFIGVREEFYSNTQGVLLVFDTSDQESFDALPDCLSELTHRLKLDSLASIAVVVCANKTDKANRVVSTADAATWASAQGAKYIEASAATGEGVPDAFALLFSEVLARTGRDVVFTPADQAAVKRILTAADDHAVLELSGPASSDEIAKAYRRLAAQVHPDKNRAPQSEDAFKRLNSAKARLQPA
eukprot:m.242381 g.242381  ORF g.242381 m.242381 type:complete len:268 (-) comp25591_c0_seq1:21-824(-)